MMSITYRKARGFTVLLLAALSFVAWTSARAGTLTMSGTSSNPTVGQTYRFTPTIKGAVPGKTLKFTSKGNPAWMKFDARTGALAGIPADANLRERYGVYLTVSDGVSSAWMPVLLQVQPRKTASTTPAPAPVVKRSVVLKWTAPRTNTDESPLQNLAGFRVVYGTSPDKLTQKLELPGVALTSVRIEDLVAGTYFFAVKAYRKDGAESDLTEILWKTI